MPFPRVLPASVLLWLLASTLVVPPASSDPAVEELSWSVEAVDVGVQLYGSAQIALDSRGGARVAYADASKGRVRLASHAEGGWDVVSPPPGGWAFGSVRMVLDALDRPHITYFDVAESTIRYAHRSEGTWRVLVVDKGHFQGHHDIGLDRDGVVHVVYSRENGYLGHAVLRGIEWTREIVDDEVVTARTPSLAFDATGRPIVAYYANGILRMARWIGYRWLTEPIAEESVPEFVSLAVDASGAPKVAFRDSRARELRYAWWSGTAWLRETIDAASDLGWDADLALDAGGRPHVSYYDRDLGMMKYAVRDGGAWSRFIVDNTPVTGWYTTLALDASGLPHFAYFGWDDRDVRYARGLRDAGIRTWTPVGLTPTSAVLRGEVTSLGEAAQASVRFEWRTPGGAWAEVSGGTVAASGFAEAELAGLVPSTPYEYRVVGLFDGRELRGETRGFETPPQPVSPLLMPLLLASVVVAVLVVPTAILGARARKRARERRARTEGGEAPPHGP